jgi:hypothetical protein
MSLFGLQLRAEAAAEDRRRESQIRKIGRATEKMQRERAKADAISPGIAGGFLGGKTSAVILLLQSY